MQYRTTTLAAAFALAAIAPASLAACAGTEVSARSAGTSATPDSASEPVVTDTSSASSTSDTDAGTPSAAGAASPLPTSNAAATRNDLLALAATADFTAGSPDTAMVQAWLATYPGIQRTFLDDQVADVTTVSASTAFLTTPLTSDLDQAWGFAVLDEQGTCAGGVVVILDGVTFPSQFVPVDGLTECTAEAAVAAVAALA